MMSGPRTCQTFLLQLYFTQRILNETLSYVTCTCTLNEHFSLIILEILLMPADGRQGW